MTRSRDDHGGGGPGAAPPGLRPRRGRGGAAPARPGRAGGRGGAGLRPATPALALAVGILLAVSCAAACIPWLTRAIGPGLRVKDPVSASQAAMSAGMAAMLLAAL